MAFKDIIGQDRAIQIIRELMRQSRFRGGYLFLGPEGVGKKLAAINLAKALNCQDEQADACEACPSCIKINKLEHPDVHLIDSRSCEAVKIEDVRQLQREIFLKAYEAEVKVFIIDNAHNLTSEAANALLKILEEPPKDTLIILITHEPRRLFKTVLSRCKGIRFSSLERQAVLQFLLKKYNLDSPCAHFLAHFSEGRLGRALKLKDTDIMRVKKRVIDAFILQSRFNVEEIGLEDKEEIRTALELLAYWFRDLCLLKAGSSRSALVNIDQEAELEKALPRYSLADIGSALTSISEAFLYLEQNVNLKLLFSNLKVNLWKN